MFLMGLGRVYLIFLGWESLNIVGLFYFVWWNIFIILQFGFFYYFLKGINEIIDLFFFCGFGSGEESGFFKFLEVFFDVVIVVNVFFKEFFVDYVVWNFKFYWYVFEVYFVKDYFFDFSQVFFQVGSVFEYDFVEFFNVFWVKCSEVYGCCDGNEGFVGIDIGGGFSVFYVLFFCLEGYYESFFFVCVFCYVYYFFWYLFNQFFVVFDCKNFSFWVFEVYWVVEVSSFVNDYISFKFFRCFDNFEDCGVNVNYE